LNKDIIRRTYSICSVNNNVRKLVEKPRRIVNNLMGTGIIIFNKEILNKIEYVSINRIRMEKDLIDLINLAILLNEKVSCYNITDKYINIYTYDDYEEYLKHISGLERKLMKKIVYFTFPHYGHIDLNVELLKTLEAKNYEIICYTKKNFIMSLMV